MDDNKIDPVSLPEEDTTEYVTWVMESLLSDIEDNSKDRLIAKSTVNDGFEITPDDDPSMCCLDPKLDLVYPIPDDLVHPINDDLEHPFKELAHPVKEDQDHEQCLTCQIAAALEQRAESLLLSKGSQTTALDLDVVDGLTAIANSIQRQEEDDKSTNVESEDEIDIEYLPSEDEIEFLLSDEEEHVRMGVGVEEGDDEDDDEAVVLEDDEEQVGDNENFDDGFMELMENYFLMEDNALATQFASGDHPTPEDDDENGNEG